MASPKEGSGSLNEEFYFIFDEGDCRGFEEEKTRTVAEWLADQGINEYNQMGEYFKELTLHEFFQQGRGLSPGQAEMFILACYDLDGFRDFLFKSTFFEKFEVIHRQWSALPPEAKARRGTDRPARHWRGAVLRVFHASYLQWCIR